MREKAATEMQYKAVLFDLDNTLTDRDGAFRKWAGGFVDRHLLTRQVDRQAAIEALVAADAGGYCPRQELFGRIKKEYPFIETSVETLVSAFYTDLQQYITLARGADQILDHLACRAIPFGIVTNGSASQLLKIRTLNLDARTSCIFVSELVGYRKPDPRLFLAAAAHLEVSPGKTLFVGDDPEADIVGAHNARMRTAWLHRSRQWPTELPQEAVDVSLGSLTELIGLAVS